MKEEEIIEGNKLIAEFMGLEKREETPTLHERYIWADGYFHPVTNLKYHSSWEWLMPACKKFISMEAGQFNDGSMFGNPTKAFNGYSRDIQLSLYHIEIGQAFWNLTKAITWYNSQKQEQESNR